VGNSAFAWGRGSKRCYCRLTIRWSGTFVPCAVRTMAYLIGRSSRMLFYYANLKLLRSAAFTVSFFSLPGIFFGRAVCPAMGLRWQCKARRRFFRCGFASTAKPRVPETV